MQRTSQKRMEIIYKNGEGKKTTKTNGQLFFQQSKIRTFFP